MLHVSALFEFFLLHLIYNFSQYMYIWQNHYHRYTQILREVAMHFIQILLVILTISTYYTDIMLNAFAFLLCSKFMLA